MLEIIQDILTAEGEAEKIIQLARDESVRIRGEADAKAEEITKNSRELARNLSIERIEQARVKVQEETNGKLEKEKERIRRFTETYRDEINGLVDEIVELVAFGADDRR